MGCDFGKKSISSLMTFEPSKKKGTKPSEIPGLALWLDANQGVQLDASSGVTQWADQAGLGSPSTPLAVQNPMGNQPPRYTPLEPLLNGRPCIHFTSPDQELRLSGGDPGSVFATTQMSFGVVFISNRSDPQTIVSIGWNQNPAYDPFFSLQQSESHFLSGYTHNTQTPEHRTIQAGSLIQNRPQILISEFTYQGSTINYLNGNRGTLDNVTQYDINPATLGSIHQLKVGGEFLGKIVEVVFFQRRISNSERKALECFWSDQYGLTSLCQ